ncbi:MAG: hypothetical protein JW820_04390, partial [Spirochaetales bacterium]|nr:hypothetical protein [Spirochaetales bacterium]
MMILLDRRCGVVMLVPGCPSRGAEVVDLDQGFAVFFSGGARPEAARAGTAVASEGLELFFCVQELRKHVGQLA